MMPLTCGRTSATRKGVVRPGNSRVSVTVCDCSVTTPTSAGGGGAGAAGGFWVHAASVAAISTPGTTLQMIEKWNKRMDLLV